MLRAARPAGTSEASTTDAENLYFLEISCILSLLIPARGDGAGGIMAKWFRKTFFIGGKAVEA
ncbi:MAG: hypothetical protein J1E32_08610, partial [Treponema sp.]|nr:hypothetical protein [Treponema sp.]